MFRFFGFILYPLCSKTFASSWNLIPLGCLFIFCIIFSMSDINILLSLSNHKGPRIALHHLWMFLSAIMILYLILLVNTFIEIIYKNKEPALIQRWLLHKRIIYTTTNKYKWLRQLSPLQLSLATSSYPHLM